MINTFLRQRLERELENAYDSLRKRMLNEAGFADILKRNAAVYVPIEIGADWNCTAGISDPAVHREWDKYDDFTVEVILRHKTLPDTYWADIQLKVTHHANGRQLSATPYSQIGNVPTHVEYETMLTALETLTTKVATIDFNAGTVVFGKKDPATIP